MSTLESLLNKGKNTVKRHQNLEGLFDAQNGLDVKFRLCLNEISIWSVYEMTCKCGDKYIGQTIERNLEKRVNGHYRERLHTYQIKEFKKRFHLANHCLTIDDIKCRVVIDGIKSLLEAEYLEAKEIKENRVTLKLMNYNNEFKYSQYYEYICEGCSKPSYYTMVFIIII
jgi:hypothetical protein